MSRISIFLLFIVVLTLSSCQSESQKAQKEIGKLEQEYQKTSDTGLAATLVEKYTAYVNAYPDDAEVNSGYLSRAANLHYGKGHFQLAADLLHQAVKNFYKAGNTPANALFLGKIYKENLSKPEAATTVFQSMQQVFPDFAEAKTELEQLSPGLPPAPQRINNILQQLTIDSLGRINFLVANDFMLNAELFAILQPAAAESPQLLYKAGEVAGSLGAYDKAISIFDWIYTAFPNFEKAPLCLFMKAFTLDNNLKKIEEARPVYEEFLRKYPTDEFADDAKLLLENLGKPDSELFDAFIREGDSGQ